MGRLFELSKVEFKMKHVLTILGIVVCWVPLFLIVPDACHTKGSIPASLAGFREPQNSSNDATYRVVTRMWAVKVACASVDGEEDSDSHKKDDEDQGQIRLWDSVLLG
jgi:hypothetical protein